MILSPRRLGFVFLAGFAVTLQAELPTPVTPKEALAFLPKAPDAWVVTVSRAENRFSSGISTVATRHYRGPVPDDGSPAPELVLTLEDTGGHSPALFRFRNLPPRPEKASQSPFGSFPVIHGEGPGQHAVAVCVKDRFVLKAVLKNGTSLQLEELLRNVDFQALSLSLSGPGDPRPVSNPVHLQTLDELNPANSRISTVYWTPAQDPAPSPESSGSQPGD
jgi:hypothetical protein